jgi:hypothetical protein
VFFEGIFSDRGSEVIKFGYPDKVVQYFTASSCGLRPDRHSRLISSFRTVYPIHTHARSKLIDFYKAASFLHLERTIHVCLCISGSDFPVL